jgi:EAL domain-containing protein (putative c-di-GMP-specific phosphodiesterase class I)
VGFAREVHGVVVAEGIERPAELAVVLGLGVGAGQGYLFSRPSTDEGDWRSWRDWDRSGRLLRGATGLLSARS